MCCHSLTPGDLRAPCVTPWREHSWKLASFTSNFALCTSALVNFSLYPFTAIYCSHEYDCIISPVSPPMSCQISVWYWGLRTKHEISVSDHYYVSSHKTNTKIYHRSGIVFLELILIIWSYTFIDTPFSSRLLQSFRCEWLEGWHYN